MAKKKITTDNSYDMDSRNTQWHMALPPAIKLELMEYEQILEYIPEYLLNPMALKVDLLVIKKADDAVKENNIAHIFRGNNIIENLSAEEWKCLEENKITVFGMYITWTKTMEGFQVYIEFDKPDTEPKGLNRHWIAHGRKTTIATKLDCCKMINALYGLLCFGNPILPMS